MADTSIEQWFIKQYESEVHVAYQRTGSDFRNFVRRSTKQPGQDITFPKYGKGTAKRGKTKGGLVPTMNVPKSKVTVTFIDSYAAQWIGRFDLLKTNVEERGVAVGAAVSALGRDTDQHIVDVLDSATGGGNVSINLADISVDDLTSFLARLAERDVPQRPDRMTVAVSPTIWGKLVTLPEFANSQWIGPQNLPLVTPMMQGKVWNNALWFQTTALTVAAATGICQMYAWDRNAVGHGIAEEVRTDVSFENTYDEWFVKSTMSQGAVLIDDVGIERLNVDQVP
jgi:hypothetical protein